MKICVDKIKDYPKEELRKKLSPYIKKVVKDYFYYDFSDNEIDLLVDVAIEDFLKIPKEKIVGLYYEEFSKFFDRRVKEFIIVSFQKDGNFVEIMNKFIDNIVNTLNTYEIKVAYLKRIVATIMDFNYEPTIDECISLINKSNKLKNVIKEIVDVNLDLVKTRKISTLFSDEMFVQFIESYCILNNIEVDEKMYDDNYYEEFEESLSTEYCNESLISMYLSEIKKPLLTADQEHELALKAYQGDKNAKDLLVERNLRLVVNIAKSFSGNGLDLLDLIQEGNIGLMKSINRYDPNKGFRLSTYATWWIKQNIVRAIECKGRNIRLPVHMYIRVKQYRKSYSKLIELLHRDPTADELASDLNITVKQVYELEKYDIDTMSLNTKIGEDFDEELESFIESEENTPEEECMKNSMGHIITELFKKSNLSPKEIDIIKLRFGFDNNEPKTLDQIGDIYGVTRERIRQIESKSLSKLRKSRYMKELFGYTDNPQKAQENIALYKGLYLSGVCETKSLHLDNTNIRNNTRNQKELVSLFGAYTLEEIKNAAYRLKEEDRALLLLRFGPDFDKIYDEYSLNLKTYNQLYKSVIPKLKRILVRVHAMNICNNQDESDKYREVLREFNLERFERESLNAKEIVIACLKYGAIEGEHYSSKAMSKFLGINESEVVEVVKTLIFEKKDEVEKLLEDIGLNALGNIRNRYIR